MQRSGRRSTHPWLLSVEENLPRSRRGDRRLSVLEMLAVAIVIAAVVAMAVWFVFYSSGGIGQGTV